MAVTYNGLLKIARIVRSIYILLITYVVMCIVAFYGLAIAVSRNEPTPANDSAMANVDRAVALGLFYIFVITAGYIAVKYALNRKLKSYPKESSDHDYSKGNILFLSALYSTVFFFLSYLIVHFLIGSSLAVNVACYTALNLVTICFVYKYLIKKIENKKIRVIFWIIAFIVSFVMPNGLICNYLFIPYGLSLFTESGLFIARIVAPILKAAR
jgi:hypothetical protein